MSCVLTVDLQHKMDNSVFRMTGVYGPSIQTNRDLFFDELMQSKPIQQVPWIVYGDFNQILAPTDRLRQQRQQDTIFHNLVHMLGLIDLRLHQRRFTWSNGREQPSFSRLDRTNAWSQTFPNNLQVALASSLSDYSPILCTSLTKFPLPNTFRFENFWLKLPDFIDLVRQTWALQPTAQTTTELHIKLIKMRQVIRVWKRERVGNLTTQKKACNEILQCLDRTWESRQLTTLEKLTKQLVSKRLEVIIHLEEELWRQRAKRTWLK
jgi:hypothetical protein